MFQDNFLKDKVILITGGGTGLGKSMALRFAELGAKLIISGRKQENLDKAAEEIKAKNAEVLTICTDVRDIVQVERMIDTSLDHFGTINVLINNAAANLVSPTEKLSPNGFKVVYDTVLMGTTAATLYLGKHWIKEKQPGSVINIVTGYATEGSAYVVPSAAAKAGVQVLTKSLAAEWGRYGIRLNGISPGPFPTEGAFNRIIPNEEMQQQAINSIPLGRFGDPTELADLAAYLISEHAHYITGEIIHIDGGMRLWLCGEMNGLKDFIHSKEWKVF